MAAATVGGSLILLQIAHHKGYIKVDWNKVRPFVNLLSGQQILTNWVSQMGRDSSSVADRVKDKLKMRSRQGCQIGKVELMQRDSHL